METVQFGVGYPNDILNRGANQKKPQGINTPGAGTLLNPIVIQDGLNNPYCKHTQIDLDMSVARDSVEFAVKGNSFMVIANSSTENVKIQFDEQSNGKVTFLAGMGFTNVNFDKIYISNSAAASGTVSLWIMSPYFKN